jgi:hypothetical protein
MIGFGILVIVVGCFCALLVPLMLLGQMMSARLTGTAVYDRGTIVFGVATYGLLAVALIWLGIGSIMVRRWARALLLIMSWIWLLGGVLSVVIMAVIMPQIQAAAPPGGQPLPEGVQGPIFIATLLVMIVAMIVLPGALLLFYSGKNVKATCEALEPVQRWTDACPLPVLALALLLGLSTLSLPTMLWAYKTVLPFFGVLVVGTPAKAIFILFTAVMGYCAWAVYRLKPVGWWIALIAYALFMISGIITFARVNLMDLFRQMGLPGEQIAQMQQTRFLNGHYIIWYMIGFTVPFFGFLIYVKKFFQRQG